MISPHKYITVSRYVGPRYSLPYFTFFNVSISVVKYFVF